jgi:hypothetical protein
MVACFHPHLPLRHSALHPVQLETAQGAALVGLICKRGHATQSSREPLIAAIMR